MTNLPQQEDTLSPGELARLERLAERTAEAEPWIPEQRGDTLAGKVLRWETGHKRGDPSVQAALIVVRSAEGDRGFYTWHAQARYKLIAPKEALGDDRSGELVPPESRLARVGDFVAITYRGTSTMDDGNEAASYAVAIERPENPETEQKPSNEQSAGDDSIPF